MLYTFEKKMQALTMSGAVVAIPDQVAEAQREYDGKTFPIIKRGGEKGRARLMGDEYGLGTPGTGEIVVKIV